MKIFNTKLYVLEEMTQEDLNNLALERNTLAEENKTLKQQLDYLRSGEYYNQLRFENEILQNVVDTNGVPSEVYDYIDCAHRNTELLEKKQKLINYLKHEDKDLKENVVNLEEKLRNTSRDSFYYNSYLKTLHRFRAKRELIKEILSKIESGEK